jgi:undecaprenyl diphosphate synthase
LWPDFGRTDLLQAIREFQKRDRRFGGLSPEAERTARDESVETVGTLAR